MEKTAATEINIFLWRNFSKRKMNFTCTEIAIYMSRTSRLYCTPCKRTSWNVIFWKVVKIQCFRKYYNREMSWSFFSVVTVMKFSHHKLHRRSKAVKWCAAKFRRLQFPISLQALSCTSPKEFALFTVYQWWRKWDRSTSIEKLRFITLNPHKPFFLLKTFPPGSKLSACCWEDGWQ